MAVNNLIEKLKKVGLREGEINIFLVLLPLSKATVSDIGRKANIKRTSVYQYLDSLIQKGLVHKISNGKRIYYKADNPRKIITILEKEKRKLDDKKKSIVRVLPELEHLYKESFDKPHISFYEGRSGVLSAYKQMVETWQDVYQIFTPKSFFEVFSFSENHQLLMELKKREVKMFNLMEESDKAEERLAIKKYDKFVKTKILPKDLKFSSDLIVTVDKLALVSFDNLVAVVIEDKAIADMQRKLLKFIWSTI